MSDETLSNLLEEGRRFELPSEPAASADFTADAFEYAAKDLEAFWSEPAGWLAWPQKWDRALEWSNPPFAKWFVGGWLNAARNCVNRVITDLGVLDIIDGGLLLVEAAPGVTAEEIVAQTAAKVGISEEIQS